MNSLGIYFGPKAIGIVESKGKSAVNKINIPNSAFMSSGLEDKVPEEIKIVVLLKEELEKNGIQAKEAIVTLSGIDLIIRTFEIPVMPANELYAAVNFEAKKYIPFKIESMVFNYQARIDKISRRFFVLFVGIKIETLEKYFSIFNQLDIKISSLEYSAFSILRLIGLSGYKDKGIMGVINVDFKEGDEADFTVIENGFPLFSRDIKLATGFQEAPNEPGMISERLKTEIRISLDYYNRKFPAKKIKEIFYISDVSFKADIEPFVQELGLSLQFIDPSKIINKDMPFSLNFLKAYGSSLSSTVKTTIKVDLLSAWAKSKEIKEMAQRPEEPLPALLSGIKINIYAVVLSVFILSIGLAFGIIKRLPLQRELSAIKKSRMQVSNIDQQASVEDLLQAEAQYKGNFNAMDSLIKGQPYVTPLLFALSDLLFEGVWFNSFSFINSEFGIEFTLEGFVYMGNSAKEIDAVNNLLVSIRQNRNFSGIFKNVIIKYIRLNVINDKPVTRFVIMGNS